MKKGYTLIEIVLALGLCSLVAVSMISLLLRYNSNYNLQVKKTENHFYAEEALSYIENILKNCKNVSVINNHIEISYENTNINKVIGLNDSGDIFITHLEYGVNSSTNNILNNISSFNVFLKENTIYLSITMSYGERYERCIGIILSE